MSRSANHVFLLGNLTRDPELRAVASGSSVCRFSLALGREYLNPTTNERVNDTSFVDVVAWGRLAETVSQYCHKGKQICVHGRLQSSSWEQDGQKRSKLEVVANEIIFTSSRPDSGQNEVANSESEGSSEGSKNQSKKEKETTAEVAETEIDIDDVPF